MTETKSKRYHLFLRDSMNLGLGVVVWIRMALVGSCI